jgi:hypothetical protein
MTWDINHSAPDVAAAGFNVVPDDVLYHYDVPLLFTARLGVIEALFYKLEDSGEIDLFLVCPTDRSTVSALKEGRLSVRGALDARRYWIVECKRYQTIRTWSVPRHELPRDFLPEPKAGLFEHHGSTSDVILHSDEFISVKFTGASLSEDGISLKTFKDIVDGVYTAVHKLFTPAVLAGSRKSSAFEFSISQPQFASLLLTVKDPVIDIEAVRRRTEATSNQIEKDMRDDISVGREEFFDRTSDIVQRAESGEKIEGIISENISLIDILAQLLPSSDSDFSTVEFNADTPSGPRRVSISAPTGERIREAHAAALTQTRTLRGIIVEINSDRRTFVLRDAGERQTTCALPYEMYDDLESAGEIRIHRRVSVHGDFSRRVRRDYLTLKRDPEFLN